MSNVTEAGIVVPTDDDAMGTYSMGEIRNALIEGAAAIAELENLKPVLALAISKLPKQQLKISLSEQGQLHTRGLEMKLEAMSGAVVLRAVKVP